MMHPDWKFHILMTVIAFALFAIKPIIAFGFITATIYPIFKHHERQ